MNYYQNTKDTKSSKDIIIKDNEILILSKGKGYRIRNGIVTDYKTKKLLSKKIINEYIENLNNLQKAA